MLKDRSLIPIAVALSLGAAISLGITRFAYGLLLPPMRADLNWSYVLAGAMNTANALGYMCGALLTPRLLKRWKPGVLLVQGALLASVFMGLSGFFTEATPLLVQRFLAGVASAFVFIAGGLLAARLGAMQPKRSGFLLGIYYGGTGFGIVASALLVPAAMHLASGHQHTWTWAWWALALACAASTLVLWWTARVLDEGGASPTAQAAATNDAPDVWRFFAWGLAGYFMFGLGYIGYMTFVVALLREQGVSPGAVTLFYSLLGIAVIASARIWARLLDRYRGGQPLALLTALVGVATILPVVTSAWPALLASGLLFGAVFLSVVASTTAIVRHNLPSHHWARGIAAFTIVFAAGQVVGPTVVGWVADGAGGLQRGLLLSAVALWLGAGFALRQKARSA